MSAQDLLNNPAVQNSLQVAGNNSDVTASRMAVNIPGAQPQANKPAAFNIRSAQGSVRKQDLRVRIIVPSDYITWRTRGGARGDIDQLDGIIFPYTPQITYDVRADYSSLNPTHGNYTQFFYQHSQVGVLNISGKFTVQNAQDAQTYLSTVHLLKALTKMRFGNDSDAGAPPPVCRLYGYGAFMLGNVPIVITSYRIDLPDSVDYFTLGKNVDDPFYGQASVPVSSTVSITCAPVYSRKELQDFSVTGWLNGDFNSKDNPKGYL